MLLVHRRYRWLLRGFAVDRALELVAGRGLAGNVSGRCRALRGAAIARLPNDAGDDTQCSTVISFRFITRFSAGKFHHAAGTEFLWRGRDLLGTWRQFVGSIAFHWGDRFHARPLRY